jgi:hypothetical protein
MYAALIRKPNRVGRPDAGIVTSPDVTSFSAAAVATQRLRRSRWTDDLDPDEVTFIRRPRRADRRTARV